MVKAADSQDINYTSTADHIIVTINSLYLCTKFNTQC